MSSQNQPGAPYQGNEGTAQFNNQQNGFQQNNAQPVPYGQPAPAGMQGHTPRYKSMNKHLFVWLGAFLFGAFGVDRFMRGQVGLGIVKLLLGSWATLGIWPLVDWIIAIVKAYGGAYGDTEDIVFDASGKYIR